jgi:hypothetical protein
VTNLGQVIREIQREAATLPTGALRTEIEVSLDVLDVVVNHLHSFRPGAGTVEELISATSDVMDAVLTIALYVRELTTRPAPRFAPVRISLS